MLLISIDCLDRAFYVRLLNGDDSCFKLVRRWQDVVEIKPRQKVMKPFFDELNENSLLYSNGDKTGWTSKI